ncbi:type 2 periplasmic-binding domain-containing protein [Roseateles albus]|uniref:Solute-binding protein family 3/N-terminal domain-containing protein n=1 Tax=Roseateles albus TaxID=2987525 RepID=A0ABT5KI97_9BURK|nr:hypothetical protein [Roseateles albus]MDC8772546.1 hypothetical protein [Roseateles albus]
MKLPTYSKHSRLRLDRRSLLALSPASALAALAGVGPRVQADETLGLAAPADVLADYRRYIGAADPVLLSDFSGPGTRRDVVEMVLVQQALALGAWPERVVFSSMPSDARLLREITAGRLLCSCTSYWLDDILQAGKDLRASEPLVLPGEFEAGIYVLPSNARALAAESLNDVRQLSGVSNRSWVLDWKTLEQLGIFQRQHVAQWEAMPKMVAAGRVDFLLAPFQATPDLSLHVGNVRLIPIPNLKIGIQGSRHFIVSGKHPRSADLLASLNRGLAQLRQTGTIRKAYTESGFFNARVGKWTKL